jgi:hypothetical protein
LKLLFDSNCLRTLTVTARRSSIVNHDELLREIHLLGCHFGRRSERHEVYVNPSTGRKATIPRSEEIASPIAVLIKKHLGSEDQR